MTSFEKFREDKNTRAQYEALALGLGNKPAEIDPIRVEALKAIEVTLEREGLGSLHEGGLHALLMANLAPFIRRGGVEASMLDLRTHGLRNSAEVMTFLRTHGINMEDPENLAYVQKVMKESIDYYDSHLARPFKHKPIHKDLRQTATPEGIYSIFLTASGYGKKVLIPQACGLLRIAYVTDFMEHDERIALMPEVMEKLNQLIERHIKMSGGKKFHFSHDNDVNPIEIVEISIRSKDRDRIRTKLIHKPSNHTAEVLDHIGLRYVTKSAADTLRLIHKLFFNPQEALFPFAHIRIARSKQRLVPDELIKVLKQGGSDAAAVFARLSEVTTVDADIDIHNVGGTQNPHTADKYRAIQITFEIPLTINGRRIMFPIEMQFLDESSYINNSHGASHEDYVSRQMQEVHDRVFENNLVTAYKDAAR